MTFLCENSSRQLSLLLVVFLCFLNHSLSANENEVAIVSEVSSSIRLPTSLEPLKYYLHITSKIHDNNLTFSGHVKIEIAVKEMTNVIVLHAKELRDFVISLTDLRGNRRFENLKYTLLKDRDFLQIWTPKNLNAGELYAVEIRYVGNIQEKNYHGIYKTTYFDKFYNISVPLAVAVFEPTYARLAFPCFDEPRFRAIFKITITHGSFYSAISNMPVQEEPSWSGNMVTTKFRASSRMPTYLVAFVICNFDYITEFVNHTQHRIFFPPNSNDFGGRALTNAIQSVATIEKYLGMSYLMPKLDHIRVKDTEITATGLGLGIYGDEDLLQTLETRDETVKRMVTLNFVNMQQWLANLVPPKWWSYSWVNSGLATYYSYMITDLMYPTWEIEDYFILTEIVELLKLNVEKPLVRKVDTDASVLEIVSEDSQYQMGAAIIKMFHHAIGNQTFVKGLQHFLNKFMNTAIDEDDFFGCLQSAIQDDYLYLFQNDKYLPEIMKTWTHNQGIPILKVTRNYINGRVTIRQYLKNSTTDVVPKWWIPLNFATASNPNFVKTTADYMMAPVDEVSLNLEDINVSLMNWDWLILNKQQTGLYHVVYDYRNLQLIADALNENHLKIHTLNKALLFRDIRVVLDSELEAIEPVMDSLKYLKFERDSMAWFEAAELINEIWLRLEGSKAYEMFRTFIHDIVEDFYEYFFSLPIYKLSFADSVIKKSIYKLACEVGVKECLAYARHQYKEFIYFNWPLDESLKEVTMCKGMQSFSSDELRDILQRAFRQDLGFWKETDFLDSLKCLRSEEKINLVYDTVREHQKTRNTLSFIVTRIHYRMSKAFPSYREKLKEYERAPEVQEPEIVSKEDENRRKEFKRKFENYIFNWLKIYELEKQRNIGSRLP